MRWQTRFFQDVLCDPQARQPIHLTIFHDINSEMTKKRCLHPKIYEDYVF